MTYDILTRIKDACDRAVAEGYALRRESWGVYLLGESQRWELAAPSSGCVCAMGAVLSGREAVLLESPPEAVARVLGISRANVRQFISGFDGAPYLYASPWYNLGHACALYYVDGVRL